MIQPGRRPDSAVARWMLRIHIDVPPGRLPTGTLANIPEVEEVEIAKLM